MGRGEDPRGRGAPLPPRGGKTFEGRRGGRDRDEVWVRDDVRSEATGAVTRGASGARRATDRTLPVHSPPPRRKRLRRSVAIPPELAGAVGSRRAARASEQLAEAARAFDREQYSEARRILGPLAAEAPDVAAVRELLGLTYYRLGRWKEASRHLQAFGDLTGSCEQHPVLADCQRALGRWAAVDELWAELKEASPGAALVAEGRIVAAGALADQGRLRDALALLEAGRRTPKRVQVHHLRLAYALADLLERAGDLPRARELLAWIVAVDPAFADAAERRAALG